MFASREADKILQFKGDSPYNRIRNTENRLMLVIVLVGGEVAHSLRLEAVSSVDKRTTGEATLHQTL